VPLVAARAMLSHRHHPNPSSKEEGLNVATASPIPTQQLPILT
jgi:hypothetical protein